MFRLRAISARAEEPPHTGYCLIDTWGYLRACGGTRENPWIPLVYVGLSPRVRRNRTGRSRRAGCRRAISARAEEPGLFPSSRHSRLGYLRACGGTIRMLPFSISSLGLSPRVRRNLCGRKFIDMVLGAISARAEEPLPHMETYVLGFRYLRACGGTTTGTGGLRTPPGLSPRVRRNRRDGREIRDGNGAISARAEEPCQTRAVGNRDRGYLRACGGTSQVQHSDVK